MAPEHKDDGYLGIEAGARYLDVSPHTLRKWITARRIEFVRMGRVTKLTRAALDRYAAEHTVLARKERR